MFPALDFLLGDGFLVSLLLFRLLATRRANATTFFALALG